VNAYVARKLAEFAASILILVPCVLLLAWECNISMGGVAGLQRSFSGGTYPCGPLSGTAVLETCSEPLRWLCDHVPVHSL